MFSSQSHEYMPGLLRLLPVDIGDYVALKMDNGDEVAPFIALVCARASRFTAKSDGIPPVWPSAECELRAASPSPSKDVLLCSDSTFTIVQQGLKKPDVTPSSLSLVVTVEFSLL